MMRDLLTKSTDILSQCGTYRYLLTRHWSDGPVAVFIMLNPSTADAENDDPTIRRCISFAKRAGCGGMVVCNLFAYRATDLRDLVKANDPVGPDNSMWMQRMIIRHDLIIAAWGDHSKARATGKRMARTLSCLKCLGVTKSGSPRHPLYVKGDTPLQSWPVE